MRVLLSGNEAVARGCYEHGVRVAVAYPGTPSTEILENVVKYKDDIYCQWSPNEKVAFEVARMLQVPLDIVIVRKLGLPSQPEVAMGAIGEGGVRVINNELVIISQRKPGCFPEAAALAGDGEGAF